METEKTPDSQKILRNKNKAGGIMVSDFKLILQSYSHQNSMVLSPKQKYRSMGQYRKSRDKPAHIWSANL